MKYSEFNSHFLILFSTSYVYLIAQGSQTDPGYVFFHVAQSIQTTTLEHSHLHGVHKDSVICRAGALRYHKGD